MDGRKLAALATEQGRNARRIRTIDTSLKALQDKARAFTSERERLYARNQAIDEGLKGLEALLEGAPTRSAAPVRVHREVSAMAQVVEAIGAKGLNEFGASELVLETGVSEGVVRAVLATLTKAQKLHRGDRGRYRVQRGVLAS